MLLCYGISTSSSLLDGAVARQHLAAPASGQPTLALRSSADHGSVGAHGTVDEIGGVDGLAELYLASR